MADKFNMQGGYFSPAGYFRIDTGGSHSENPNGGVQIGVDEQGIPNMLEENESVYEDFVFSDNIRASKRFLDENHIPEKYAGKLYSEIADVFVDEAKDRPLDTVSNNGLRAMLTRLASAQEGQKQEKDQRELEKELSALSPEELSELEAMLAGQEPAVQEEPLEQPQMMATGGLIHRFDTGTPGETVPVTPSDNTRVAAPVNPLQVTDYTPSGVTEFENIVDQLKEAGSGLGQMAVHFIPGYDAVSDAIAGDWAGAAGNLGIDAAAVLVPGAKVAKVAKGARAVDAAADVARAGSPLMRQVGRAAGPVGRMAKRAGSKIASGIKSAPQKVFELSGRGEMLDEAGTVVREAREAAKTAKNTANAVAAELDAAKTALKATPDNVELLQKVADLEAKSAKADAAALKASARTVGATAEAAGKGVGALTTGPLYNRAALEKEISGLRTAYESAASAAKAAPKDKALQSVAEEALKKLEKAEGAWNKWWHHGEWQWKAPLWGSGAAIGVLKNEDRKDRNWAEDQFADGGLMRRFDAGTPGKVYKEDGTEYNIGDVSDTLGIFLGYDDDGVAMWDAGELPSEPFIVDRVTKSVGKGTDAGATSVDEAAGAPQAGTGTEGGQTGAGGNGTTNPVTNPTMLPTWPRYAGAVTSGLLGIYNAVQRPDRYNIRRYNPTLPSARLDLVDPSYNPIDQNILVNDVLASGAGTARSIVNSGAGPSTGALLVAADANTGRNIGDARVRAWDANNQRRNDVIGQRNSNATALANFDYGMSRDRAQIQNTAQLQNIQNDLIRQRLNYASEGEKYAAIQSNIDSVSKALAGIGNENFAMNQINNDTAYDYIVLPDGRYAFMPKAKKEENGGPLMRPYKKK